MNIIEQASRRLEELRRAGIDIPDPGTAPPGMDNTRAPVPAIAAAARAAEQAIAAHRPARRVQIDLDRLERDGQITPRLVNRALAEELRIIKMELLRNVETARSNGMRGNLVLVTSAVPGEGKTYLSLNLAMSIAMEIDHHALLVDADVLRPTLLGRLGLPESPGLLDLATRPELDVSDVLLRVLPKLSVLPAGTPNHMSPELLASGYMDHLLTELSERYADRIIIFDAPPILVASGARRLAASVGQVLMVVRADSTDSRQVGQAFAAVESCPLVCTVLNQCATTASDYGYYEK